eukprot:14809965-Alexandrium_andersonii.AAC.1
MLHHTPLLIEHYCATLARRVPLDSTRFRRVPPGCRSGSSTGEHLGFAGFRRVPGSVGLRQVPPGSTGFCRVAGT